MSSPKDIHTNRRRSIAKLTRSPLSSSPIPSPRFNNSFSNQQFMKKFEGSSSGESNVLVDDDDEDLSKYLNDQSLKNEGGDITRDIYKLIGSRKSSNSANGSNTGVNDIEPRKMNRTRSLSQSDIGSRRGSTASSINVPGGFRRAFIQNKKRDADFVTRNFLEFLTIYGHFAGEDLEDDEDIACHYNPYKPKYGFTTDENTPLIGNSDPFDYGKINPKGTATDSKAYFLLVKAFVGTGVLFLPKGFSNGGVVFLILLLAFFGFLSFWCYLILVYSKQMTKVSSFGDIGSKLYGKWLQQLIILSIIISQVGFIAAYMVFTSTNIQAFLSNTLGIKDIDISWFIIGQLVLLIPLSLIRDITKLSLVAVFANFLILFGLFTIIYFIMNDLIDQNFELGPGIEFWFNQKQFSLFIGTAIFAFEGIGLIIPIQDSMIYPNHFPQVLGAVILTISIIMIFVGTIGYITYGEKIQTVILLNLPQDSPLIMIIQLFYSLAILLSTPLQIFPAVRLIESKLFTKTGKYSNAVKWGKNLFRSIFVILTAIIALYGGKNLDKFVSFVGCFACIPLVYMYPPMLHLRSCCDYKDRGDKKFYLAVLNYVLLIIGLGALIYTTYDLLFN